MVSCHLDRHHTLWFTWPASQSVSHSSRPKLLFVPARINQKQPTNIQDTKLELATKEKRIHILLGALAPRRVAENWLRIQIGQLDSARFVWAMRLDWMWPVSKHSVHYDHCVQSIMDSSIMYTQRMPRQAGDQNMISITNKLRLGARNCKCTSYLGPKFSQAQVE